MEFKHGFGDRELSRSSRGNRVEIYGRWERFGEISSRLSAGWEHRGTTAGCRKLGEISARDVFEMHGFERRLRWPVRRTGEMNRSDIENS